MEFHKKHGKEGTIIVTKVKDPTRYGVVVHDSEGLIDRFVEKPKEFVGDEINAGLYIFKTSMIKRIEARPTSIERETFPQMAADKELYCMCLPGYWMDIGQPKDFVGGTQLYLKAQEEKKSDLLAKGDNIKGNVIVHPTAKIHPDAEIGPNVVIGADCVIGPATRIHNSTIMKKTKVGKGCLIKDSIIGAACTLGNWIRVTQFQPHQETIQLGFRQWKGPCLRAGILSRNNEEGRWQ